jgi:uncharacterized membrane protein
MMASKRSYFWIPCIAVAVLGAIAFMKSQVVGSVLILIAATIGVLLQTQIIRRWAASPDPRAPGLKEPWHPFFI